MPSVHDDEFELHFPAAKDRTLRRIAIIQVTIGFVLVVSLLIVFISGSIGLYINGGNRKIVINNLAGSVGIISFIIFIIMFLAAWIMGIIESVVLTRRYGWRAVSDPIEARRVAMREALYDVATGSTQAKLDIDGDRTIVVPTRRLRPVGARLELTAERDKAQVPRGHGPAA